MALDILIRLNTNNPNENLTYSDIDILLEESSFNKLQTGLKWDNFMN